MLSFNLVGVTILLKIKQFQIRREIKWQILRGVPDEKLCAITIREDNDSEFFWLEDDEFFYRGSMYDVVRKVPLSQTEAVYYCINDVLEENLLANLDALVERHKAGHEPLGGLMKKLYEFLTGLYCRAPEGVPFYRSLATKSNWYFSPTYRSVFLSTISPPPRIPVLSVC